ncbi:hypothetical protein [Providencia rettgeri]|uniref:hypothetical protein n=1 Tax=Providencia rettgeri TaxID=587 RepID=UPI0015EB8CB4|nr:hypothetical protein [Providencia rettgeri]QLR03675.1 hypothetical protein H0913_12015 [Providencia rettgeri]
MRTLFALLIGILLMGCTMEKSPSVVMVGMTTNQVMQIEGTPDEQANQDGYQLMIYHDKPQPEATAKITDRWFIFKNEYLLEYSTQYLNSSNVTNTPLRLTAKQILSQWIDSQSLPTNPSARMN